MTLAEYLADSLSHDEPPPEGVAGQFSDWLLVDDLEVTSGKLWIGDAQMAWAETRDPDGGCVVPVPSGKYRVEGRGVDFGGYKLVAGVRVVLAGADHVIAIGDVGECGTDSGQIGVADAAELAAAFAQAFGEDVDAALDALEAGIENPLGTYAPLAGHSAKMVYVPSGGSDGGGSVLELLSGSHRVGIEHIFIPDGTVIGSDDDE
jgi:hypothetical protein